MYKGIIFDFDGTLTRIDVLDYLANAVGKGKESGRLREDFQTGLSKGVGGLIARIDLLRGTKISFLKELLNFSLLHQGHEALRELLQEKQLPMVIVSGNISPVVRHYQNYFGAREVFCTELIVEDDFYQGIYPGKVGKRPEAVWQYFEQHCIDPLDVIAIGDDLSDVPFFEKSGWSIGFNAKGLLVEKARQLISGDLSDLTRSLRLILEEKG